MIRSILFGVFFLILSINTISLAADNTPPDTAQVEQAFGKLPLYFIENQGQIDSEDVAYCIKGADKTLYFTSEGITFSLQGDDERWTVKLEFVGANPGVVPRGEDMQEAVFSYFKGKPEDWKAGCPTYGKVVYEELWPGIDLVYSGTVNELKYEFVVAPGADPMMIRLAYRGATDVEVNESGELVVRTPVAEFEDGVPYAYQEIGGGRVVVDMAYRLREGSEDGSWDYGFEIGNYDRNLPLFLDPEMLVYCGYIGGSEDEYGGGIAVDSAGAAYITGNTESSESEGFPVLIGPNLTFNDEEDAFVAKVDPSGTALEYCGYIGGSDYDCGLGIAVDSAGAAYITGRTRSSESEGFPVLIGPDLTYNDEHDEEDAFVAKVDPSGTALEYCGYIGGSGWEDGHDIAVDSAGAAYVTGETTSRVSHGFPVLIGPDLTHKGSRDAFVAKVEPSGAALEYCGYIGGADWDNGNGIAVDGNGAAYISGRTKSWESEGFPVLIGPDLTFNGSYGGDAFVAKVDPSGAALEYCGYIGGEDYDSGYCVAVDGNGAAYITGYTESSASEGFPVLIGPDLSLNGDSRDAFVAKVDPSGAALEYCGYIGGESGDEGSAIAVDSVGAAYIAGKTYSSASEGFPVLIGPGLTHNGSYDAFVAKVEPSGAALEYCGYIGGNGADYGNGIAVDSVGAAYVSGSTRSSESGGFPVHIGPYLTYNGEADIYVAKVEPFIGPVPDIKVNGDDGPLVLSTSDDITVTIHLDPRDLDGEPADWWVATRKLPSDTWWAKFRSGQKPKWTKTITPIRFAGATLRTVNGYSVLGPRTLPMGDWVFGFGVDGNKDGVHDAHYVDTVEVTVN